MRREEENYYYYFYNLIAAAQLNLNFLMRFFFLLRKQRDVNLIAEFSIAKE